MEATKQSGWLQHRFGVLEWNPPTEQNDLRVNIGAHHVVVIDKLYGPWSVWEIRARLDYQTAEWIIEQQNPSDEADAVQWIERARFTTDPTIIQDEVT